MYPQVIARMGAQHGLITRRQAIDAGLTEKQVRRLLGAGSWVVVRRGVYVDADLWAELDIFVGQPRLRALAAGLVSSLDHVFSHDSAADLLGMPIIRPKPDLVHLTQPGNIGQHTAYGIKHHIAPYDEDQVVDAHGVRCLDLARTAVDIAREHGVRHGLAACDGALRMGATREQLRLAVDPMRHWTGVPDARVCIELADGRAETVAESILRWIVEGLGIGKPEPQFELRDGERWARCDLRVGRHIFEMDGKLKLLTPAEGGVSANPRESLWDEKLRQDWLHRQRLGVSRVIWADCWEPRLTPLRRRLLKEYLETEARWGSSIDDLRGLIVVRRSA